MFTRLGRKIISDIQKTRSIDYQVIDDEDDSFRRFNAKCEDASDVYYHGGGHGHSHGPEMTEDERYEKAMYQLKCVTIVGLIFVSA